MNRLLLATMLLVTGCAVETSDITAASELDIVLPHFQVVISNQFTTDETELLLKGLSNWEKVNPAIQFTVTRGETSYPGDVLPGIITITRSDATATGNGQSHQVTGQGGNIALDATLPEQQGLLDELATHEIGHVLGLLHNTEESSSVMSPEVSTDYYITQKDADTLCKFWNLTGCVEVR